MHRVRIEAEGCDVLEIDNITIMGHILNDRLDPRDDRWGSSRTAVNTYKNLKGVWCHEQRYGYREQAYGYTLVIGTERVNVKKPHTHVQLVSEQSGATHVYYVFIPNEVKHSVTLTNIT